MATEAKTGMDKQDMKRLLGKARQDQVNCAIGMAAEPGLGLLVLDPIKSPKAIEQDLIRQNAGARNTRPGRAYVDTVENPKQLKIIVTREISGIARRLVKTLKGTGITKVVILLEDGTEVESYAEEEEATAAATAAPAADAAEPAPAAQAAATPDAATLAHELGELIKRIPAVAAAAPAQKDMLAKLAKDATLQLRGGSPVQAQELIRQLHAAMEAAVREAVAARTQAAPAAAAADSATATYDTSRKAWLAARAKVAEQIETLRAAIVTTYEPDGLAPELERAYGSRVQRILATLDTSFADVLAQAEKAPDPATRAGLVTEAQTVLQRYQEFANSEPLIDGLDDNPFVPLAIRRTLDATFAALGRAFH